MESYDDLPPAVQAAYAAHGLALDEVSTTPDEYVRAHAREIERIVAEFVEEQIQDGWHEDDAHQERDRQNLTAEYSRLVNLAIDDALSSRKPGYYAQISGPCAVTVVVPDATQVHTLQVLMAYLEHAGSLPLARFVAEAPEHV